LEQAVWNAPKAIVAAGSPQRRKERTLEALFGQLEGLARQQPVVMLFEDAHWIDPTSRELK
jgi:predicted ATPase